MSYIDLEGTKGINDIVLNYGFSNCNDYKLDQASMTFTIENDGVTLSTADHN